MASGKRRLRRNWPVLKSYDQEHLTSIAMPLGGIGAGTVSLGGRGDWRDWEVMNRPAKGFNGKAFFAMRAQAGDQEPVTRVLEGVLQPPYEGATGAPAPFHGLPRFRDCEYHVAYPFAQVLLADRDVPVKVRIEAFNPLIPGDAEASGLPLAVVRFVLHNPGATPVRATVCGSIENFIGHDGSEGESSDNRIDFRRGQGLSGLVLTSDGVHPRAPQYGSMSLSTNAKRISYMRNWGGSRWRSGILHFWDALSGAGRLTDEGSKLQQEQQGSLAAEVTVPARGEESVTFLLTWHFPNRQTWTPSTEKKCCVGGYGDDADRVGNYYCTRFADAWAAAKSIARRLPALEKRSLAFVSAFCRSDLPEAVKEAALFNLSTLRSQTCFRTEDGHFFGWEGGHDRVGCCLGSCTHVWNYEQATAFLFGDLARDMREIEFLHATDDDGFMQFRTYLPLDRTKEYGAAATDGQMGCLMKLYRDWQLSGDNAFLKKLWPRARAALAFCWMPCGWDADQDGVMEGCQHNTLDVEYYGPTPLMQGWYLGALSAGEEMARHLGDDEFADRCRDLFDKGRAWTDEHLFNGEYYEQDLRPASSPDEIAKGLTLRKGSPQLEDPDFQLGPGCLVDQMAGDYMAQVCGLDRLFGAKQIRRTLKSIMKYNFKGSLYGHFNNMRTFALNDEQGLLMCTYPRGGRPRSPVPYFNELMTGFEYTAAVHMLYEGMAKDGLKCIAAIRARYDGHRRNPFNEAECGNHYARAMASWAAVLALTGFQYSAVERRMQFKAGTGEHFWSNGSAWGTVRQRQSGDRIHVALEVLHGKLDLASFALSGWGQRSLMPRLRLAAGQTSKFSIDRN